MSITIAENQKEQMNIVIVGHVDHGKSTIIGRLLADTHTLPEGKLDFVRAMCEKNSKPFEYAFLLDALKDEQSQGITIDSSRVFFQSAKRRYLIIDAPGHIEFLKNMITGAARAEAALLVIDADEGVKENSRRHGTMLEMLGIKQVAVLVNKMDLVDYDQKVYDSIRSEYSEFLSQIGIEARYFLPVSGRNGDNVASRSKEMPWSNALSVLDALDEFQAEGAPTNLPFRMPVQDVYKFTQSGDSRRIIAGTVETGRIKAGDEVAFYPSGKKSRVKSLEDFVHPDVTEAIAHETTGFTLEEQIYVKRGEVACLTSEQAPKISSRIRTSLFWLGQDSLVQGKEYLFKLGTATVTARLEEIDFVLDASTLSKTTDKDEVGRNDVAECTLSLKNPIAFDSVDLLDKTSRFVLVDEYRIAGGGIIREALEDQQSWLREKVLARNLNWERSAIASEKRWERYHQKPALLLLTGDAAVDRKGVARALEQKLFDEGKHVYYMGISNVLYGVDADIKEEKSQPKNRSEHLRRLSEVAHLLLDSGQILIVTARDLSQEDLELISTSVAPDMVHTVWVGDQVTTSLRPDIRIEGNELPEDVERIKSLLVDRGAIFRPW